MCNTAIQMILILHYSGVLCKLHILDRELDHFSCPVLLCDSNAVFAHNSQRAWGRFLLWITKVSGPTKTLHILNAEEVLITVWGAVYLYLWEIYGLS